MRKLPEEQDREQHPAIRAVSVPAAAAKPIIGGIAPGNAPTVVDHQVRCFIGV